MTTQELCKSTGLTPGKIENWVESGLLEPTGPAADGGRRREFAADQVLRARLIQALQGKGVSLGQLAGSRIRCLAYGRVRSLAA